MNDIGGVSEGLTEPDELQHLISDLDACRAELGLPVGEPSPLTEAEARDFYVRQTETWQCLRHEGYNVAAPPSEEAWLEQYWAFSANEGDTQLWMPWADPVLIELPPEDFSALERTCPQWYEP